MEFPLYPYAIAIGYRLFGFHEQIGRVISYVLSLATLLVFIALAAYVLPPPGAVVASLFFALDPIVIRVSNAMQAEPLMMFAYVAAVYAYIRWLDDDRWLWYGLALALTSLAILAKAPAAHLGIVFVFLTLWRQGWRAFRRPRLWVFAVAALIPPALWYARARGVWLTYGNSLGVSNHQHILGLATITHLHYIAGIARREAALVWMGAGALAVALALVIGPRPRFLGYGLLWYAAVFLYLLVIAGTSTDPWGAYYHIVAVAPAALLIGGAAAIAIERWRQPQHPGRVATAALIGLLALIPVAALRRDILDIHPNQYVQWYATARQFTPLIPPGVTIAVSGAFCGGRPTESAYNQPWYLYWTDHKGFTPCIQDHTMPVVRSLIARGAQYFIVERSALAERPGFENEMRRTFPVVSETPIAILFRLR
jgi:4-amino-4-deoxy-L-arabinose transferase-like glycosyltransferase